VIPEWNKDLVDWTDFIGMLRLDLNDPPTPVGVFQDRRVLCLSRLDLNHPPTPSAGIPANVGGIRRKTATSLMRRQRSIPYNAKECAVSTRVQSCVHVLCGFSITAR
jgi:hypothetical protein